MPTASIIPVLAYDDVRRAVAWLCSAFGFSEHLAIGDHRAQLTLGAGAIVVVKRGSGDDPSQGPSHDHSIMVRVEDVESHCAHAWESGAHITQPPVDQPYGERQYTAVDLGGHTWTFSQSIADVHPDEWGGALMEHTSAAS